jgi:hypothetical protein
LPASESLREETVSYLNARFGVSRGDLADILFVEKKDEIWAATADVPAGLVASRPAGLRALRRTREGFKPTSVFLRSIGKWITFSRIEIESVLELQQFLLGQPVPCAIGDGFAAVSFCGDVIGCGAARGGLARTVIPTHMRRELLGCLEAEANT